MTLSASVVIPAYNEGDGIIPVLGRIADALDETFEVLVVVDTVDDTTIPSVERFAQERPGFRVVVNTYGRGPAPAIRYGIDQVRAPVVVVTMADGSDDPRQIPALVRLVERGVVVAAASRYTPGGQQVGGPLVKGMMSRTAGLSLAYAARVGTRDATNSFKAYSTQFVREVGIHSRSGFEIGLELTAKARRLRRPVAELPTVWLDRDAGDSNFQLRAWLPRYLAWYFFAFGPRLTVDQVRAKAERITKQNDVTEELHG